MRVRLGTLREFLMEALLSEEAWVPGRWMPGEGEPVSPEDADRLGDPLGMEETDARMLGDDKGPGEAVGGLDIADHLRNDEEGHTLGNAPDETMREGWLADEIRRFLIQENPAGAGMVDPREPAGAYTAFDMTKDHTGTDDLSATWYRSPGRAAGEDGDPFRGSDPYSQLGFHPPKAQDDPTASPPAADGEEGTSARLAPDIWQLSAGSDTSKVLGANAKPDTGGVGSGDESEEGEEGNAGAEGGEPEEGAPEGEEPGSGHPERGRD